MTTKTKELIAELLSSHRAHRAQREYAIGDPEYITTRFVNAQNALADYIEELERKAQAWDSMLASPCNAHPLSTDHMHD